MAKQTTDKKKSRLVYSTDAGRYCPACNQPKDACICHQIKNTAPICAGGHIYLQKESKGRAGKPVTTIKNLPLNQSDLKKLAKQLKAKCGVGGTVDEGLIIIQGDQREKIKLALESQGYSIKISGG